MSEPTTINAYVTVTRTKKVVTTEKHVVNLEHFAQVHGIAMVYAPTFLVEEFLAAACDDEARRIGYAEMIESEKETDVKIEAFPEKFNMKQNWI